MAKIATHQRLLLVSAVIAVVAWLFARPVVLPLVFLNTHVHEMCHAITAAVTGGSVLKIQVFSDGSGVTLTMGGWEWAIASAGYVGASVVGSLVVLSSRSERGAKVALGSLLALLVAELAIWLRGDGTGIATNVALIVLIALAVRVLNGVRLRLLAAAIGVVLTIAAFESLTVLWQISLMAGTMSDAALMQKLAWLPAWFWVTAWSGLSAILLVLSVRAAWRNPILEKGDGNHVQVGAD